MPNKRARVTHRAASRANAVAERGSSTNQFIVYTNQGDSRIIRALGKPTPRQDNQPSDQAQEKKDCARERHRQTAFLSHAPH